jgi:TRAP transporter 4TM/12TM fusion protein
MAIRDFRSRGVAVAVSLWAVAAAVFHLYSIGVGLLDSRYQRAIHFLFILPLAFVIYPAGKQSPRNRPSALDGVLAVAAIGVNVYVIANADRINLRWEGVTWPLPIEILVGAVAVVLTLEAARRAAGAALAYLTVGFLAWLFASSHIYAGADAPLSARFGRMIEILFLFQGEGVYGNLLGVAASYIALFVLFGAFIEKTGASIFFIDLARVIVGRTRGSAGKITVLSSGLFGSVCGQGTANVYTTGTFTIPLMIRGGYAPSLAAGIEAGASMGGALLPPVMGTAAFVIADFLGISLTVLMKRALIPAIFYFVGMFLIVHLEASRNGTETGAADERPSWGGVARNSYLMSPLAVLVVGLLAGYSALAAGLLAIGAALVASFLQSPDRHRFLLTVRDSLVSGTKNTVMVSISCACAGIIVAAVTYSGLAVMFGTAVISIGEEMMPVILVLAMLVTLILGIGLPATPSYILTVSMLAPSLSVLGLEPILIHLFVFYFAILADVSPPACVTTYAAAGLAGADPMKAGMQGLRASFTGFLVPFIFVYRPALTLSGSWPSVLAAIAVTAFIVWATAVALVGWAKVPLTMWERALVLAGAMVMVYPAASFLAGGLALTGAAALLVLLRRALVRRRQTERESVRPTLT